MQKIVETKIELDAILDTPIKTPRATSTAKRERLASMFQRGGLHRDYKLNIIGVSNSQAVAIDHKRVRLDNGSILTWNAYGEKFTGHVAVNIYRMITVNDQLLETLREY